MSHQISHLFRHLTHLNTSAIGETLAQLKAASGKPKLFLLADMAQCVLRYGAGYKDYQLYEFYKLTPAQRATYVTRGVNEHLNAALNSAEASPIFDDKALFYQTFSEFLHRRYVVLETCTQEEFLTFLEEQERIVVKPRDASCGQGVRVLNVADFSSPQELYRSLREDPDAGLAEEVVIQHPEMQRMYSGSVNTVRICTILKGETAHLMYAFLRVGNSDAPVDNLNAGGVCAPLDLSTGIITHPACDKKSGVFEKHPRSGCEIVGFQIPFWKEAAELCLQAAVRVPKMRYVGWDVAITESGPLLIEGNNFPGFDILQLPAHLPEDKTGMLPRFRELLPELKL